MIKIEGLTKRYKIPHSFWKFYKKEEEKVALDNVSCSFPKGTVTGLVGPNGSGKTTTMRLILNLIPKDSGTVTIGGSLDSVRDFQNVRKLIGYLPEERGLYNELPASKMLYFFADMYGIKNWKEPAENLLKEFDLFGVRNHKVGSLSKGMKQKASIVRMMLHQPEIILLDEPMTGLDPESIKLLSDYILKWKADNKTIIISTHLLEIAENLCDRLVVIYEGRRIFEGSKQEFKKLNRKRNLVDNYVALIKEAKR